MLESQEESLYSYSAIHIIPGDQPFEPHYSTYAIQAADVFVFRFEFCSEQGACLNGDEVEGWYVDDIRIINDNGTYNNHGSNQGATLQMHPGNHILPADWQWVEDNYAPHEYKSATHSWWVPDTTRNHRSWLLSPWIQLPDTAILVFIDYWQDQFSPGAAELEVQNGGLRLLDYYSWYVRDTSDLKWRELGYDYDRYYDTSNCDWDVNWRLWEDPYSGTFFAVPDRVPYGSTVQFAIKFQTDDVVQYQGKQECAPGVFTWHDARGLFLDDVTFWGAECYDDNLAMIWSWGHDRPLPFSVPAGSSWACSVRVWSKYACGPTQIPGPVDASVDPPNTFLASDTIPTGFPGGSHDTLFAIGTFTASQAADTAQTLNIEVTLPGDDNLSGNIYDNIPEFLFYVTDSLLEYCGYDDFRMKTGARSWTPYNGVGVTFCPRFNWGNWKSGTGEGYKIASVNWLSAYKGSTRVRIWPLSRPGSKAFLHIWHTPWWHVPWWCWWIHWHRIAIHPWEWWPPFADTTVQVPKNDWVRIDFYDDEGNVPPELDYLTDPFLVYLSWEGISADSVGGVGFDGPDILGGHTFLGISTNDSTIDSLIHYIDYEEKDPAEAFQDACIRARVANRRWVPPPEGEPFIRGDYNVDGLLLTNDPIMELQHIFGVPGAPPPSCKDAADYNDDGFILTNDPIMALQYIFGVPGAPPPWPPYGTTLPDDCGPDPTEDDLDCASHPPCGTKGVTVAYKPSVNVKDAVNRLVGEPTVADGVVRVPVDLTLSEVVCGFDISLGYDVSSLQFKEVVGGDSYDFYAVDTRQDGVVRIGCVPDIEMADLMGAGTHRVGEILFTVEGKADVELNWRKVEVYGSTVEALSVEWVVKAGAGLPKEFALSQNYPNPFNPTTLIEYALPMDCQVRLEVYNVVGQRVATLVDGEQAPGYKRVRWNTGSLSSGIYFYRLKAGDFVKTRKMILLR